MFLRNSSEILMGPYKRSALEIRSCRQEGWRGIPYRQGADKLELASYSPILATEYCIYLVRYINLGPDAFDKRI